MVGDYGTIQLLKVLEDVKSMTIEEYNELYKEVLKDIENNCNSNFYLANPQN